LRSKNTDILTVGIQQQVSILIESADNTMMDIIEETKYILEANRIEITQNFESKIKVLTTLISSILKLRGSIEQSILDQLNIDLMFETTVSQLNSLVGDHQDDPRKNVRLALSIITELSKSISKLYELHTQAREYPSEWLSRSDAVISKINSMIKITEYIGNHIGDPALKLSLQTYTSTMSHILAQFKILTASVIYSENVRNRNEFTNYLSPLKDLAYLLYPYLYNFRDAATLLEVDEDNM